LFDDVKISEQEIAGISVILFPTRKTGRKKTELLKQPAKQANNENEEKAQRAAMYIQSPPLCI
jgi:hypothetical protein